MFHCEYSQLGDIRSSIPDEVHVIALTATATIETRSIIIHSLNMVKPLVVSLHPGKVIQKKSSLHQAFEHLYEKLKIEGKDMGRVLIFCQKYTEVTALYFFFKHTLKECFTYPAGSPDYIQNWLVDMYTSCTHASVKAKIVERFTKPSSLPVVIGTIAFAMGINCSDIREVIATLGSV